jgi:NAD(P)H-quinone oxidoreductase subunit 5
MPASVCAAAAVALPLAGVLLARWARAVALLTLLGAGAAVALLTEPSRASGAWWPRPLGALLAAVVDLVAGIVIAFAVRQLRGGSAIRRFAAGAGLVAASMTALVLTNAVVVVGAGFLLAHVGFELALAARPGVPGLGAARRAVRRGLGIGDAALVATLAAVALLGRTDVLSLALARVGREALWVRALLGAGVLFAALSRSAQGPFAPWIRRSVAATTPASALLHAGVANGGVIVLLVLGARIVPGVELWVVLGVVGAGAILATEAARLGGGAKGQLISSTIGQMGFASAEWAAGLAPAALVHVIGHALYKAYLLLTVGQSAGDPQSPRPRVLTRRDRGRGALLAGLAALAAGTPGLVLGDGWVIALLIGLSGASVVWQAWPSTVGRWRLGLVLGAPLALGAFGTLDAGIVAACRSSLPSPSGTGAWALAAVLLLALLVRLAIDRGVLPSWVVGWLATGRRPIAAPAVPRSATEGALLSEQAA